MGSALDMVVKESIHQEALKIGAMPLMPDSASTDPTADHHWREQYVFADDNIAPLPPSLPPSFFASLPLCLPVIFLRPFFSSVQRATDSQWTALLALRLPFFAVSPLCLACLCPAACSCRVYWLLFCH